MSEQTFLSGIWTSKIGIAERYCSGNWRNDNGNGGTEYGVDVGACQAECDSMASCYGIAVTTNGTRQCVTCTGEDQTLTYNAVWTFHEKPSGKHCWFYSFNVSLNSKRF